MHQQEVEELWRGRLAEAKARYETAVERFRTTAEDFRTHQTPTPDGGFGVHLAIAAESSARKEYMRVLRVFTDLLLNGKIPEETVPGETSGTSAALSGFPRKTG
jgi:hypothetical protein